MTAAVWPSGHAPRQVAWPSSSSKVEISQGEQADWPVEGLLDPGRQSSHVKDEVAPTVVLYLPLGKWGGVWGVLARFEEIDDFLWRTNFGRKGKFLGKL